MNTITPRTPEVDAAWTGACAPWCAYQDDADYFDGEVGNCLGVELHTPLSLAQQGTRGGDLVLAGNDFATTYAARRPGRPDVVAVGHNYLPPMELTPDEARQLIEALQLVLGQIGHGGA